MNDFEKTLAKKYDLDPGTALAFVRLMKTVEADKNVNIVEKGGFNDNFYILRQGILRAYFPTCDIGQTLWFGYPGQAIFNVWCFRHGSPSPITIETITPCELYYLPKQELDDICFRSLPICNLVRKIFVGHATEAEESFAGLLEWNRAIERYLSLLKRHPELLQKVPLKKLASYLQLTPQSLSRIRAQIK